MMGKEWGVLDEALVSMEVVHRYAIGNSLVARFLVT